MKILVAFTGGTIGSSINGNIIGTDRKAARLLTEMYKEKYETDSEFILKEPYYVLSENNTGKTLSDLISFVLDEIQNDYDGIILTHGTDTLQYSAAALSCALGADCKPIMLVSSSYVLTDSRANGLFHFAAAVDFIKNGFGRGVFVPYKNGEDKLYIHRAGRLLGHSELSDELFSVKNRYYGSYNDGTFIKNPDYSAAADEMKPFGKTALNRYCESILVADQRVGFKYPEISEKTKAVLIKTYHSGTLCTDDESFISFAEQIRQKNIPCFICGADNRDAYESTEAFEKYNFKILPPAAFTAQYIKLWMAAEKGMDLNKIYNKSLGEDLL